MGVPGAEPTGAQPATGPPAQPAAQRSTVTTGTIELLGIVTASQALGSETSIDGLQARVVGVLSAMTGATSDAALYRAKGGGRNRVEA